MKHHLWKTYLSSAARVYTITADDDAVDLLIGQWTVELIPSPSDTSHFHTQVLRLQEPSALIRWTRTKFCPECGKYKVGDTKEDMISACDKMWRKYMRLSDSHCPLWTQCRVEVIDGSDKEVSLWERMPRIIGRS
ncbi:hypothetical protein FOZ60_001482 [Perkinsus olseni]|uniref:Uncharacterized protein n=1 Tax=Perkinsus olseni TaxID=32597 RepID=A0A7J6P0A3_PEROL|nr:hypothetical protein FOZ60_001482 [Perkinsus olseni]